MLLQMAVGAASERLYLSYPRIDVAESRARAVLLRARCVMRRHRARSASRRAGGCRVRRGRRHAGLAGAVRPDDAIDDQEHDLAVLRSLLDAAPAERRGTRTTC